MEIDHFNPTLKGAARHKYRNLMWSTRLCNNAKHDYWPSLADRRKGIRFLNPCKEWDYGVCIFENPITHELIGKTPAARYHIEILRLNDESFIFERSLRTTLSQIFMNPKVSLEGSFKEIQERIKTEREKLDILIPPIPCELVLQSV